MKIQISNANKSIGKLMPISSMLVVLALILCTAFTARAQNTSASVRGTVTDTQGAAVAGADVTITDADTGYQRSQKTDSDGSYVFPSLPLGRYTLVVTKEGFKAFEARDVVLHVADSLTMDARLDVGNKSETIEVVASTTQVELTNADLSGTISGKQITELPLNGRSYAQLLLMVPGVSIDNGFQYNQKGLNGGAGVSVVAADDLRIKRQHDQRQGAILRQKLAADDLVCHHTADQLVVLCPFRKVFREKRCGETIALRWIAGHAKSAS